MVAKPHAFVAMPFGKKPDATGQLIDFDRVYHEYLAPALELAGLQPFRADQEVRAGDIRTDMFQELLVADLVVADLTINNANVWYELGVRHALRARGVVLVFGGAAPTAFDVYTDRKNLYHLKDGAPDPATLEADKAQLAQTVRATMESWHGRKVSPVYQLLPNLEEPHWKSLRLGEVNAFWSEHDAWTQRIDVARKTGQIGDVLVLADEAPVAAFRAEAWITAGAALRKLERFNLALEQFDRGLAIDPANLNAEREKGMCLQRLGLAKAPGHSLERAREHYRAVIERYPRDPETWALLGRVDKDAWIASWHLPGRTSAQMRDEASFEEARLRGAIESYSGAYRADPRHYYSGVNALVLMHLHQHLTGEDRYGRELANMIGAVRFAAEHEPDDQAQFWARSTLADIEVLVGSAPSVTRAYREAIAKNERDWFAFNSSSAQLRLLRDLDFRPEVVDAALAVFARAMAGLQTPEQAWQPRQVILFSGHRVDTPDRKMPRFPADKVPIAAAAINKALDESGASPDDLAFCQAASGGDLLFLEACQARGVRVQVLLPFPEAEFVERSVIDAADGEAWRKRYYAATGQLVRPIRCAPTELGEPAKGVDPFERCNLWLLYSALACGIDKLRFITLWNGGGGDGPGGTAHMYEEVKRRTGRVNWIDPRKLW